jgi:hypothetical protein
MRIRTAVTVGLVLLVASNATAGIARIGGVEFGSLDEAVEYFWEGCRDDSLNFEICFSQPFRENYADRRFEPCDRVSGSRHQMPPEVQKWLKRYDPRRVDLRIVFNWAHIDERGAPAAEICKALEAYSHEALLERERLKRFNEKHVKAARSEP